MVRGNALQRLLLVCLTDFVLGGRGRYIQQPVIIRELGHGSRSRRHYVTSYIGASQVLWPAQPHNYTVRDLTDLCIICLRKPLCPLDSFAHLKYLSVQYKKACNFVRSPIEFRVVKTVFFRSPLSFQLRVPNLGRTETLSSPFVTNSHTPRRVSLPTMSSIAQLLESAQASSPKEAERIYKQILSTTSSEVFSGKSNLEIMSEL